MSGDKNKKLEYPIAPIPMYKMFCPWLFFSTFSKYSLLNCGIFNIRKRPKRDAKNPMSSTYGVLAMAPMMNKSLRTL